ncbi:MAG TPA: glycosyltransferase family 9 protein [Bacteroidales bacterium]|nr:glycosyltransferase family 9 protein [Bacteroidales bacterium]HPS16828.1 glycosyltransferase family 9 protein [Bacteroidales bacterium]
MNTSTEIKIDRLIVKPIAYILNLFVRLAGKLLKIDHSLNKKFKTLAISKYKGMGSIIQATPLIQSLRKNYPEAKIIFITTQTNEELLKKIKCIDEIIVLNDRNSFILVKSLPSFILKIISKKIDIYYDLEIYSNISTLISALSMAKNRFGFYLRSSDYRLGIYTHMMFYNVKSPIYQTYLQFARLSIAEENIVTDILSIKSTDSLKPSSKIIENIKSKKYIVINPNASDLRIERRWDAQKFSDLIKRISEKYPSLEIILIGNKNEKKYVDEIINSVNNKSVISLAGETSVEELIAIIENAEILITNDTGPLHLAFATKTKVVALFGPCSPAQYANIDRCSVIYKNVYCSPCVHEFISPPCNGNNICMKLIKVDEVFDAFIKCKENIFQAPVKNDNEIIYKAESENNTYILGRVIN